MENLFGKIFGSFDEYKVVYINSLALTIIALGVLFCCHSRHWRHKLVMPLFYSYLCMFVSLSAEIAWGIVDGKPKYISLNYIFNMLSYICFALMGYSWLYYCFDFFPGRHFKKTWVRILCFLPVLADIIMILLSPVIKLIFYVDEKGNYTRGPMVWLQMIWYCYLFISSVIAAFSIKKVVLSVEKARLKILSLASLPCFLIGGVQMMMPPGCLPSIQFSVFLLLFCIFVHEQEQRITVDLLTKLKTRYEFEKLLSEKMKKIKTSVGKKLFVVAGDINGFKLINDNFGHSEGDLAIRKVGDVMDKISNEYKAVSCRRSGDEFLMAVECNSEYVPKEMTRIINRELDDFGVTRGYKLVLSFGIVQYKGSENIQELVNKADRLMYEEKRKIEANDSLFLN